MSVLSASVLFLLSFALSFISSIVLARDLDKLGARLHLSEGLLGIITALGADAPEISAAVTALSSGQHDLGLGVVLGSNIFNLAALLGLSAVVAGRVRVRRPSLLLDGIVAFLVAVIAAALILGAIGASLSLILLGILLVPYVVISALRPKQLARLRLPAVVKRLLRTTMEDVQKDARKDQTPPRASSLDMLSIIPALVSVVLGSIGMVQTASHLGNVWGISPSVVGTLVLATLTGIPNVVAAVRLALHKRGSAVVSEALNSNTFNVLAGICLPILFVGLGAISGQTILAVGWLLGMTLITLALAAFKGGVTRLDGEIIIALYLVFALIIILWG